MVGGGLGERERLNGKAPIVELSDESSARAVITSSDADCVGSINAVQTRIHRYVEHGVPNEKQGPQEGSQPDPPQAIEKPTDAFGRPSVHGAGTSTLGERQLNFGYTEILTKDVRANYDLWAQYTLAKEFPRYPVPELRRVLHENNGWFAPSYRAISSDYASALAAERRGQGRKRGPSRQGYPKLNTLPRDPTPIIKPHEPCYIFERELQSIQNASAEGAKRVTEEWNIDITGPQCGTDHMDSCEGETRSADTECGPCYAQCGTGMDACEGEASVHNECHGRYPQCGTADHMDSCEGETSTYIDHQLGVCCCSDDQLEEPIQFAGGLSCYTCLGRIIEESTSGGSEASNSLLCMDTSSYGESLNSGSEVETSLAPSCEDAVVPQI